MITISSIPSEVKVKETFEIKGTTSPELAGKAIIVTVDNRFTSSAGVVGNDNSWTISFMFNQDGNRKLKVLIADESEIRDIKVSLGTGRLRFTNVPSTIKTEEKFTLSGDAEGFDDGDELLLSVDGFVVDRPRVSGGKWQAAVLLHTSGKKRLFELKASEQDKVQIELDVQSSDVEIISRRTWFDNKPPAQPLTNLASPKRITIHHFADPSVPAATQSQEIERMRSVRNAHMTGSQGFSDIGYHYVIMASGRIYEGRPEGKRGAHDVVNDGIGIAFDGDYTSRTITNAQFDSAVKLCTMLCRRMGINDPTVPISTPTADFGTRSLPRICAHQDRVITGCPGVPGGTTVRLKEIREKVKASLELQGSIPTPANSKKTSDSRVTPLNTNLKPLFPNFQVPERQLRSPDYPKFNSPVLGNVIFTGGFMEPHGHAPKPKTRAIMGDGKVTDLPPSDRNLGVDYYYEDIICWYAGVVTKVGWEGGYGNRCHVTYEVTYNFNGKSYPVKGAYAHATSFSVAQGDRVKQGQVIGKQGGTGGNYPPHIDYRQWIEVNHQVIDLSPNVLESQLHRNIRKTPLPGPQPRLVIHSPKAQERHNLSDPVQLKGEADKDIVSINVHSPFAGADFFLGKTTIKNGSWIFARQFQTGGKRTIIVDGLNATNQVISMAEVTVELFSIEDSNNIGSVRISSPENGAQLDLESTIAFSGVAQDERIVSIKLRSPFGDKNFILGLNIPVNNRQWNYKVKFNTGGLRKIIAEGIDANGNRVDSAEIEVAIKSSKPSPELRTVVGIESTSQSFRNKVIKIASDLQVDPNYLMAAMSFETGGTFSPSIKNAAGSGATGLIQFMPSTARGLGTSVEDLSRMTAEQQLDFVKKYFQPYKGELKSLEDVYMAILYPAAVGKGPNHILFRRGTTTYQQNMGLDINGDGHILVGEATELVKKRFLSTVG